MIDHRVRQLLCALTGGFSVKNQPAIMETYYDVLLLSRFHSVGREEVPAERLEGQPGVLTCRPHRGRSRDRVPLRAHLRPPGDTVCQLVPSSYRFVPRTLLSLSTIYLRTRVGRLSQTNRNTVDLTENPFV